MRHISLLLVGVLICSSMLSNAEPVEPWKDIAFSLPFKKVWSALLRDEEGTQKILDVWIERKFEKTQRVLSSISIETLGGEAVQAIQRRLIKHEFEKLLFCDTASHRLYGINVESGVIKWVTFYPRAIQYKPFFGRKYIYAVSNEVLFANEREFGIRAWRKSLSFPVSTSPVVGESGLMYLSSWEDRIFCFDTENRSMRWQYRVGGNILAAPLYVNGLLYIPADNGILYCLRNTGELVFEFHTHGTLRTSPKAKGAFVILGSDDNSVYCINRYNGAKIWESRVGRAIYDQLEIIGKNVYIKPFGEDRGVVAVAIETGKILWEIPYTSKIVGFGKGIVYLYTGKHERKRYVLGIEEETGRIVWVWDPAEDINRKEFDEPLDNVNEINKVFFVNYNPGKLYMLVEKGFFERIEERVKLEVAKEEQAVRKKAEEAEGEDVDRELEALEEFLDLELE